MIRLLTIDLLKLKGYRTFWVIIFIYFALLGIITSSGMEALRGFQNVLGGNINGLDMMNIPLYHFPDIWQNLTYVSLFFNLLLGILIIITITNEFTYKTVKQNIIDGMDRKDFVLSKVLTIGLLSLVSTIFVMLIGLITGSIYSPDSEMRFIFSSFEFIPAFFLQTFAYLLFIMLISMVIKRAGLAIVIMLVFPLIELILGAILPNSIEWLSDYMPHHAINNLIHFPFQRYAMMEIQDFVSTNAVLAVIAYIVVFIYLSYRTLSDKDLG